MGFRTITIASSTHFASSRACTTSGSTVRVIAGRSTAPSSSKAAVTIHEASAFVARLRARGERIVFTNGVFDLLHVGHLRYLQHARSLGDALIVGLNSDQSVREIKGADRPITVEAERAEILQALTCVDAVVIFDESTPHALIQALQPDVLAKGADWAADAIVGRDIVEASGGRVVRIPIEPGHSTTAILSKIRAAGPGLRGS